jgi:hypothetical protein
VTRAVEYVPPGTALSTLFDVASVQAIGVTGSKTVRGIVVFAGDTDPRMWTCGDRPYSRSWDRDAAIADQNDGPDS